MDRIAFTPEIALDLWYEALGQEIGILIPIENPADGAQIQARLYEARKAIDDPRLDVLQTHLNVDCKTLFVYRKPKGDLP